MTGARIEDGTLPYWEWPPGAYGRVRRDGAWVWRATTPTGLHGDLTAHDVVEHEDGTITVEPSILVTTYENDCKIEWHGYLRRGVWSEA